MMDDTTTMLRDTVARLLKDHVTAQRTLELEVIGIDAALWKKFADLGLRGDDAELGLDAQMAVLQEVGRAGAFVPYAESEVLGRRLAHAAGLRLGEATLAPALGEVRADRLENGKVQVHVGSVAVPWGRHAERLLVVCRLDGQLHLADIATELLEWRNEENLAAEPRDVVVTPEVALPAAEVHSLREPLDAEWLILAGALCASATMVGALDSALQLAVAYSRDRSQFGKPISQFQMIQSYLAEMAAETCAAAVAHELGVASAMRGDGWGDVAVAKIRTGQAASAVAKLAHQVHGAIGMTREYPLNIWTRRLWAWREEFGNEAHWSRLLGGGVIAMGEQSFWPRVADTVLPLGGPVTGATA